MLHAKFVAAAFALGAVVAIAHGLINYYCFTRAQAQTQTTLAEPTIWDHNDSIMYLVANGSSREFYYQKPRSGMLDAGARPGSVLFRGEVKDGQYFGTAYIFNQHCGVIPFDVRGQFYENDERITLTGQAPRVGRNCRAYETYTSNLEFKRLKPNELAQSRDPFTTPPVGGGFPSASPAKTTERITAIKDALRSIDALEVPSTPVAQAPAPPETDSGTKDLEHYVWGAMLIVMVVFLCGFWLSNILIKHHSGSQGII